jgi:hypothetical protein
MFLHPATLANRSAEKAEERFAMLGIRLILVSAEDAAQQIWLDAALKARLFFRYLPCCVAYLCQGYSLHRNGADWFGVGV